MRILFVCLGNICRSPIAEGILRHYSNEYHLNWEIASAGLESYHAGSAPHQYSQKICRLNGVDISAQRAKKFSVRDLENYDKVYAMSEDVYDEIIQMTGNKFSAVSLDLFLNELMPGSNTSVPDPWYGDEAGYKPVYEMINKTCKIIIEKYKEL